jgi:hypothetical protein
MVPAEIALRIESFEHMWIKIKQGTVNRGFFYIYLNRYQNKYSGYEWNKEALEPLTKVLAWGSFTQM